MTTRREFNEAMQGLRESLENGAGLMRDALSQAFPQPARQLELDLSVPVELIEVKGWRLQFVPSSGNFAGLRISRVFVTLSGELGQAKAVCRNRYGSGTIIHAGAALHFDSRFGDWHE